MNCNLEDFPMSWQSFVPLITPTTPPLPLGDPNFLSCEDILAIGKHLTCDLDL